MARNQIHHSVKIFFRVIFAKAFHSPHTLRAVNISENEIKQMFSKRIVHRRIHFVTAEILSLNSVGYFIRRIFPNFANHNCIGIGFLQLGIKSLRKFGRQFVDNVKPPAAYSFPHPVMQNAVIITNNKIHIRRVSFADVRQSVEIPPAIIFIRKISEIVPLEVRRIF